MSTLIKKDGQWKTVANKSYIPDDIGSVTTITRNIPRIDGPIWESPISIDLSSLSDGIYMLLVEEPTSNIQENTGLGELSSTGLSNGTMLLMTMSGGATGSRMETVFKKDSANNIGAVISHRRYVNTGSYWIAGTLSLYFTKIRNL